MEKQFNVSESPDRWVIVKVTSPQSKGTFKVFGTWAGGYLGSDRWKLNSGITSVDLSQDRYYFYGASGSCYMCYKKGYGFATSYGQGVLLDLIEKGTGVEIIDQGFNIELLEDRDNWEDLLET